MGSVDYEGQERRTHFRVVYSPQSRPVLMIRDQRFEVVDISEGGLKALNFTGQNLDSKWIRLTAVFLGGQHMDLVGRIVWSRGHEFGLRLKNFFPTTIINRENSEQE